MVSVCTVPARGGRSCEHFGGYKTINRIPLPLTANTASSRLLSVQGCETYFVSSILFLSPYTFLFILIPYTCFNRFMFVVRFFMLYINYL